MTITFPISLPATPNFVTWDVLIKHATGRSQSPFTFFENVQEHQGAKWEVRATLPRMNRADANEWFGKLASLRGGIGTFLMGDPDNTSPLGTGAGTPLVNGASQTGVTLITNGWGNSQTVLKVGDWFQLGSAGSASIYLITADAVTDGSGNVTLDFVPRLRSSPGDGNPLTINATKGRWRMISNDAQRASDLAKFRVGLVCREAL